MSQVQCCIECFTDETIREHIAEYGAPGDCDFCGSEGVTTLEARELRDLFKPVIDLYEEVTPPIAMGEEAWEIGEPLADLINYEWGVFSDLACDRRQDILEDMCRMTHPKHDDGIPVEGMLVRFDQIPWYTSPEAYWSRFVRHVTQERRYVLQTHDGPLDHDTPVMDPREWLPETVGLVRRVLSPGTPIWRARIAEHPVPESGPDTPPSVDWLGAPPPDRATAGRANPSGIPSFYAALHPHTAAAEKRPALGQSVWVAQWTLPAGAAVADLTEDPPVGSPFGQESLRWEIESRWFLREVSARLALPIAPHEEEVQYVPTQYVAEVIRDAGLQGIIYKSVQDPRGANIVLFDPKLPLCPSNIQLCKADGIAYQFKPPLRDSETDY